MTARSSQIPSLRILPSERKLIEDAATAAGQSVTDWARDQLLKLATDVKFEPAPEVQRPGPKRYKSGTQLKAVATPRRGLDLDEETLALLHGK
jgi:hypothetical protein